MERLLRNVQNKRDITALAILAALLHTTVITVTKGSLVINHYGNINKSVRDYQTMSIIQLDRNDLLIYPPFQLKYLLPSLLLLLLLRNHPTNLDQRIQRFRLYLMKSLMMIQRDTYHHKQFIRVFVSYLQPQHHLRRKKYRHHLLHHHHHHHIHLRKCCYRHRNRCHRSNPQKL